MEYKSINFKTPLASEWLLQMHDYVQNTTLCLLLPVRLRKKYIIIVNDILNINCQITMNKPW